MVLGINCYVNQVLVVNTSPELKTLSGFTKPTDKYSILHGHGEITRAGAFLSASNRMLETVYNCSRPGLNTYKGKQPMLILCISEWELFVPRFKGSSTF